MAIKSVEELVGNFFTEVENQQSKLTDKNEGSNLDVIAGAMSIGVNEVLQKATDNLRKSFIDTSNGPEITNGPDELQDLAVDHWGEEFSRPGETHSTGMATFSRPNTDAGNVQILKDTIVKTPASATGKSQRFKTIEDVTLTDLTITVAVRAVLAGPDGDVQAGTVTQIETALTDSSVVVTNVAKFAGGRRAETDSEYRETIRRKVRRIRGGTKDAIEAAAKTVGGVEMATAIELEIPVIAYDIATDSPVAGAEFFRIPLSKLYVADSNGTASEALILDVYEALREIRAYGIRVEVLAAAAIILNWIGRITLNPGGPNYAELSSNPGKVIDSMIEYINRLPIGDDFVRTDANAAIMAIWGPAGTGDLTEFETVAPSGDVENSENEKFIAGTVGLD